MLPAHVPEALRGWRRRPGVVVVCGLVLALGYGGQPARPGLYDTNPNHLWNRIHEHFHVRIAADGTTYGFDSVDPLLWRETRYLLSGPSHERALRLLDEFLTSGGERLIVDPLERGVFQHDLWAVFDWLASTSSEGDSAARSALMQRVARVIRRVALTRKEIDGLPDTHAAAIASGTFAERRGQSYEAPLLPRDLFDGAGPWVGVGGNTPVARQHASELSRSAFIVLWSVPGGSAQTSAYLRKLWDFPQPYVSDESIQFASDGEARSKINPALPPVPDGTRIALARKMMVIDTAGVIVATNVIQSIQLRAFPGRQAFSEVTMSRADLFARKAGGLRMIRPDEGDFVTFSAQGLDPLERASPPGPLRLRPVLDGCINCHHVGSEPPIQTVPSLRQILRPMALVDSRHERWARWFSQTTIAAEAKSRRYDWGVLQGIWRSHPR